MRTGHNFRKRLANALFGAFSLALGLVVGVPFFLIAASPFIG